MSSSGSLSNVASLPSECSSKASSTSDDVEKALKDLLSNEEDHRLAFCKSLSELMTKMKKQTVGKRASVSDLANRLAMIDAMVNNYLKQLSKQDAAADNNDDVSYRDKKNATLTVEPNKKHDSGYGPSAHSSADLGRVLPPTPTGSDSSSSNNPVLVVDSQPFSEAVVSSSSSRTPSLVGIARSSIPSEHSETSSESESGFLETSGPGSVEVGCPALPTRRPSQNAQPVENSDTESTNSANSDDFAADEPTKV